MPSPKWTKSSCWLKSLVVVCNVLLLFYCRTTIGGGAVSSPPVSRLSICSSTVCTTSLPSWTLKGLHRPSSTSDTPPSWSSHSSFSQVRRFLSKKFEAFLPCWPWQRTNWESVFCLSFEVLLKKSLQIDINIFQVLWAFSLVSGSSGRSTASLRSIRSVIII